MKLEELYKIIKKRRIEKPDGSYVATLVGTGLDRVIQKVGEEAVEVMIAAKNSVNNILISETADLLFHLVILLEMKGIDIKDIDVKLDSRRKE